MRITAIFSILVLSAALPAIAVASPSMAGTPDGTIVMPHVIQQSDFTVSLNKTEIVQLPQPAAAIVVGNPKIADVSVHSNNTIFIVGRGYGDTNIIILDSAGQTVMNANIKVVGASTHNNVRVFNGGATMRSTYNCSPYCQPAPILGDDPIFVGANSPEAPPIANSFAGGTSTGTAQNVGSAFEHSEGLEAAQEPDINDPSAN